MGLADLAAKPCGASTKAATIACSCLATVACIIVLAVSGSVWSERAADDWYDFRGGRATCALLNRSVVPFRAFRLAQCSTCSPPSGPTGSLGPSCSAYTAQHERSSPYANDGRVGGLTNGAVCSTGRTSCCREECDTCRSCTGSGSSRSCTTSECRCRCVGKCRRL